MCGYILPVIVLACSWPKFQHIRVFTVMAMLINVQSNLSLKFFLHEAISAVVSQRNSLKLFNEKKDTHFRSIKCSYLMRGEDKIKNKREQKNV